MADLYFKIIADTKELDEAYKKLDQMGKLSDELTRKLSSADPGGKEFKELNKQLSALEKQYEATVKKVAQLEGKLAGMAGKTASSVLESSNIEAGAYESVMATIQQVLGVRDQNLILLAREEAAIKQVASERRTLEQLEKNNAITAKEAARQRAGLIDRETEHKQAASDLRMTIIAETKEMQASDTSMRQMSLTLGRMREAYRQLSETERNSAFGQQLQKDIHGLNQKMITLDAAIGNHQRNVGNYASSWNGLSVQVQQVARELPALSMGANTFFLAISNNLPMLADEIKKAQTEYRAFQQAVKSGATDIPRVVPVWKQLLSSVLSWQTALVVGITLLTVYGKEIVNWVSNLAKGGTAAKQSADTQKTLNTLHEESVKNTAKEIAQLQLLYAITQDSTRSMEDRTAAAEKLQKLFPNYFGNLSTEIILIGNAKTAYEALAKSIESAAAAKILENKYAESVDKMTKVIKERNEAQNKLNELNELLSTQTKNPLAMNFEEVSKTRSEIALYTERLYNANEAIKAINQSYKDFQDVYKLEDTAPVVQQSLVQSKFHDDYIKKLEELRKSKELFEITQEEFNKKENEAIGIMIKAAEAMGINDISLQSYVKRYKEFNRLESQRKIDKKAETSANTLQSEQSDRLRAIEDYRKSISEAGVQAELDIRQQGIEAMDEGSKKELAMIHLNYDRLRDANRKRADEMIKERQELERKQWEYDNPGWKDKGMAFKPTTMSVQQLSPAQQRQLLAYDDLADIQRQKATKDHLDKERQAMDEYLKEYGTYLEKKQAITDLYNERISKASTGGGKMTLKRQLSDEMRSLDLSEFKKGINFAEVFGNLDNLTPDSITRLRDKLKEYINKAASGLRPEDLKELSDALTDIEIKTAEKNPFGEIGKSLEDYRKTTEGVEDAQDKLNYVMAGGEIITGLYEDGTGKLCKKLLTQEEAEANLVKAQDKRAESLARMNTALAAGVGKAQEYLGVATAMVGALEDFGVEVPEQLTGFIDGMGKALDSLESINLTNPVSIVKGAIGVIGGLGKAIGSLFNNDKGKQKNIERLQDQIDVLDKSYEKLGDSIGKAFSKDASNLIDQQNKLLEQQKVLIQQQIREEEDKKKTDDDRVKEWRDQMDEIDKTLADNKEKAKDAIFGEDLKSAIENFADAYANAWASGEDRAKSAKDTVRNMMRQMVTESIKAAMDSSKAMEQIRTKLEEFYADNVLSGWEQDYIYKMAEGLQREMDDKFGWADSLMRDNEPKDGVSGQLQAAMTEGTASQLVGLWNSTSIDMRELKQISLSNGETVSSILTDVSEIMRHNILIEQNTRRGADNTDGLIDELRDGFNALDTRLGEIERNTKVSKSRG